MAINKIKYTTFSEFLENLKNFRLGLFPNLSREENIILSNLDSMSVSLLKYQIQQYTCFSKEAIHMLLNSRIICYSWKSLADEISENIKEELGKDTKGKPHLEMMKDGYLDNLNIDTDSVSPNDATKEFLNKMHSIFKTPNIPYLAGALIAFEGVAIEEFHIMEAIIRKYQSLRLYELEGETLDYIKGHQEFEIGHEQHLIDSIAPHINSENSTEMARGFFDVSQTINNWWSNVYSEIRETIYG